MTVRDPMAPRAPPAPACASWGPGMYGRTAPRGDTVVEASSLTLLTCTALDVTCMVGVVVMCSSLGDWRSTVYERPDDSLTLALARLYYLLY